MPLNQTLAPGKWLISYGHRLIILWKKVSRLSYLEIGKTNYIMIPFIASKDIILDAFLPITFKFAPLDKVTLHRIRIYVTETMEYYCREKKVHRMEPTKKFLLTEQKGPKLPNLPNDANLSKAKNMGNLLQGSKEW